MLRCVHQCVLNEDDQTVIRSKFNLLITRCDIKTLRWDPNLEMTSKWLNDEVINFYMELLAERSRLNDNLPKVHAMSTFFLKKLLENNYSSVKRWTKKVDIFAHDIILIPVHKGKHWCLAIIHIQHKTIKYYEPNQVVLNKLVEYLRYEYQDKKKEVLDIVDWTTENVHNIPQQENCFDCGRHSVAYMTLNLSLEIVLLYSFSNTWSISALH